MAKFVLILGGTDVDKRTGNPAFAPAILEHFEAWVKQLTDAKRFVSATKLRDQVGARLSMRGGEIVDGPFVETKESIGGIFVIEADSLEQATQIGRGCPTLRLQNGFVEVRAVERG